MISEYLLALQALADAERLARRYPTPAVLQRVIAAKAAVERAYNALSFEAKMHQPVRIGVRRPGYLETRHRRIVRAEWAPRRTDL